MFRDVVHSRMYVYTYVCVSSPEGEGTLSLAVGQPAQTRRGPAAADGAISVSPGPQAPAAGGVPAWQLLAQLPGAPSRK